MALSLMNAAKQIALIFFFILAINQTAFAQPSNDDFGSATSITSLINGCSLNAAYTTTNATPDQSAGTCAPNGPNYNVWFKFKASATGYIDIQLNTGGAFGTMRYSWVT
ncbi:MAG: hypothetical protein JST48_09655, partial [Bacteroidetes bacterium]|nr:hypothetical protein [Bacteroidota bacterium]